MLLELVYTNSSGVPQAPMPDATNLEVSPMFSDVGVVKFKYPKNGANAQYIVDGNEFAVYLDGVEIPDTRFMLEETGINEADEAQEWDCAGNTSLQGFRYAIVYPPGWPASADPSTTVYAPSNAGTIIKDQFAKAQARGALVGYTCSTFTNTTDSNGAAWSVVVSQAYDAGVTLLSLIQNLVQQSACEVKMVGKDLRVYNPGTLGTDLTASSPGTILRTGRDAKDSPRKTSRKDLGTVIFLQGASGRYAERTDSAAVTAYGRREIYANQSGIDDNTMLNTYGDAVLGTRKQPKVEKTYGLVFAEQGTPEPVANFNVGDWIYGDTNGTLERLRIKQWTLKQEAGVVTGSVVLNDMFADTVEKLMKQVDGILGVAAGPTTSVTNTDDFGTSSTMAFEYKDSGNIVQDGSFEDSNVRNMRASGTNMSSMNMAWSSTNKIHGNYYLTCGGNATTTKVFDLIPQAHPVSCVAGERFYVRCYSRKETGTTLTSANIEFVFNLQGGGTTSVLVVISPSASATWEQKEGSALAPANAISFYAHWSLSSLSAGTACLDAVEIRKIIPTAIIEDAAITNAKINDLAASKITTGTMTAAITLSGSIKTATSGARVEIDASGIRAYNSGGTNTVNIVASTGAATIVGVFKSAASGQRVEISSYIVEMWAGMSGESSGANISALDQNSGTPTLVLNTPITSSHSYVVGLDMFSGTSYADMARDFQITANRLTILRGNYLTGSPVEMLTSQAGNTVVTTDANAYASITPGMTNVYSAHAVSGDTNAFAGWPDAMSGYDTATFGLRMRNTSGTYATNATIRLLWSCVGR